MLVEVPQDYSVCTATCYRGGPTYDFHVSILRLMHEEKVTHLTMNMQLPANAREELADLFMKESISDWLLFLDSDMAFPPGLIPRLLSWGQPLVGGLYFQRGQDLRPHMYNYVGQQMKNGYEEHVYRSLWQEVGQWLSKSSNKQYLERKPTLFPRRVEALMEIEGIGTGCLLIHRSVLEGVPRPWFSYREGGTEDLYFSRKAIANGFQLYGDMSVVCSHNGVTHVDYLQQYVRDVEALNEPTEVADAH